MQSTLNPNVKPFPAYIPSPIAPPKTLSNANSNSNSNTNSPPSITGSFSTHNSRSPNTLSTPFPAYQVSPTFGNGNGNDTRGQDIKQFGQGWKTTPTNTYIAPKVKHNASMSELTINNHNSIPSPMRTRSPSMPSLHTFGESDHIVPLQSRDRYKHLQVPVPDRERDRVSKYDHINGHSYTSNNNTLGHSTSIPDLVGGYHNQGQGHGYRRSSLVTSWRNDIPEDSEVEHHTLIQSRYEPQVSTHHLASSRSVPAFATGAITTLSPAGQPTQSRNIYISSLPAHVTYDQLERDAEQFGETMSVKLDTSLSATSRAYVMFKNVYDTHEYYTYLKKQRPGWTCELAKEDYGVVYKSLEDKTSSNLYIQGFSPDDTMEYIQSVLHPAKIVSHSRPVDNSGNIRGIVMARVQSRPQADEVIERLHGQCHPETRQALEIRIADSEKQYKKLHSSQLDGRSSMPNMRNTSYNQPPSSESNWFANPSRETSYTSLRSNSSIPRTPVMNRTRQPSNLSFGNSPWSSRTDTQWGTGGEPSTPTSQYFGIPPSASGRLGQGLGHRGSNEKLDMEGVRMLWLQESGGY